MEWDWFKREVMGTMGVRMLVKLGRHVKKRGNCREGIGVPFQWGLGRKLHVLPLSGTHTFVLATQSQGKSPSLLSGPTRPNILCLSPLLHLLCPLPSTLLQPHGLLAVPPTQPGLFSAGLCTCSSLCLGCSSLSKHTSHSLTSSKFILKHHLPTEAF